MQNAESKMQNVEFRMQNGREYGFSSISSFH